MPNNIFDLIGQWKYHEAYNYFPSDLKGHVSRVWNMFVCYVMFVFPHLSLWQVTEHYL